MRINYNYAKKILIVYDRPTKPPKTFTNEKKIKRILKYFNRY